MTVQLIGSLRQLSTLKVMIIHLVKQVMRGHGVKIEMKSVIVIALVSMWTEVLNNFGQKMRIRVLLSILVLIQVPLKLKYCLNL